MGHLCFSYPRCLTHRVTLFPLCHSVRRLGIIKMEQRGYCGGGWAAGEGGAATWERKEEERTS